MATSRIQTSSILQGFPKSRSLLAGNTAYDPAATFLIQRVTATGGETSITFSSIPQTYKHLQIRGIARDTYTVSTTTLDLYMQFNSDTTSANYAYHTLYGNGSSAVATGTTSAGGAYCQRAIMATGSGPNTTTYGSAIIDIVDYASTSKYKTIRSFNGVDFNTSSTNYRTTLGSSLWLSTSAITRIDLKTSGTAFAAGTTFALYGFTG